MKFIFTGILFGILLVKSEVLSWFRIQEMFLFDSFHMYGIIGSAVLIGFISWTLIKKYQAKDISGNPIQPKFKDNTVVKRYIYGGLIFGLGWGITGACPGPMYALIGSGYLIFLVPLLSAILGAVLYGILQPKLPH